MEFTSGSVHKGTTTFSNPKSAGFDYQASLCMGAGWTVMASSLFHLNAGQSKAVEFSVTMPTTPGSYPLYFKVSSSDVLIGTFASEGVVIMAPQPAFSNLQFNGMVNPSLLPGSNIRAQFTFTTPEAMAITEAYIFLGKLYERGTEPQPIACPVDWPPGSKVADMGYIACGPDYVLLPLPVLADYWWSPETGWFRASYAGTRNPWYYSSGHSTFPMSFSKQLITGNNSMIFPRTTTPGVLFLQPVLAGVIYGYIDVLLLIGPYYAVFPSALGVEQSSSIQIPIGNWIEMFRQPYLEPPVISIPEIPTLP